jgi:hypothetical protein
MAYGIDQQVSQTADAYRDNPGGLQQKYALDQKLVYLLALQKLKSEADAAANEIAMSQEGQPGTIAQQRGEEAIQRTKNEVTEAVSGVKAQQLKSQQQNIQRMVGGAPGARPGGPPQQMAGIAGQPAPNMARMAGGGIVTFQEGGEVSDEDIARKRRELGRLNPRLRGISDARVREMLASAPKTPLYSPEERRRLNPRAYAVEQDRKQVLIEAGKLPGGPAATPVVNGVAADKKPPAQPQPGGVAADKKPPVQPQPGGVTAVSGYKGLDREGIAARYKEMTRRQREIASENAAERKKKGIYALFAGRGGKRGLSGIGLRGTLMDERRRQQRQDDLKKEFGLGEKAILADTKRELNDITAAFNFAKTAQQRVKATNDLAVKIDQLRQKYYAEELVNVLGSYRVDNPNADDKYKKARADIIERFERKIEKRLAPLKKRLARQRASGSNSFLGWKNVTIKPKKATP